jgi:hypothetical protein
LKLAEREKKFVIAGAIVAATILLFYFVSMVLPSRDVLSSTVDYKKKLLAKQRETIGSEHHYKGRLTQYRQRLDQDLARLCLISDTNTSLAAAELQRVLTEIAGRNGIEIIRKDVQPEQKLENQLVKVSVRIEVNCEPQQLVEFLTAVQNHDKFLSVDELMVNSFRIQKRYEIRPIIKVAAYIVGAESKPAEKTAAG